MDKKIEISMLCQIYGKLLTEKQYNYIDDYYNKDTEDKGIAEIIIAKQRNGPIGTVNLVWLPEYTKFANMER